MKQNLPIIGVTMGDPVGIGPELILKAFKNKKIYEHCRPVVMGDALILEHTDSIINSGLVINKVNNIKDAEFSYGKIDLLNLSQLNPDHISPGSPDVRTGQAMLSYITTAADMAINNEIQGMATCPINKVAMKLAGSKFHGHTELIAERAKTDRYVMMLTGKKLSVVLVTIHIPFDKITTLLTPDKIVETISVTGTALKDRFGLANPRIAVAGLNPHSGEDGLFGNQEKEIIEPAIKVARKKGFDIHGPLPPDTVFYHAANGNFDVVVCMYHDQGLIPFKMIHFSDGVNTTLGLPIVRTSVDHGTAYDIAGKGIADPGSLIEAIKLASFQAAHMIK